MESDNGRSAITGLHDVLLRRFRASALRGRSTAKRGCKTWRTILGVAVFTLLASSGIATAQMPDPESKLLSDSERARAREWNRRKVAKRWSILHIAAEIQFVTTYDTLRIRQIKKNEFRFWLRWDDLRDGRPYDSTLAENELKCDTLEGRVIREIIYAGGEVVEDADYSSGPFKEAVPDTFDEVLRGMLCQVVFPDWREKQK